MTQTPPSPSEAEDRKCHSQRLGSSTKSSVTLIVPSVKLALMRYSERRPRYSTLRLAGGVVREEGRSLPYRRKAVNENWRGRVRILRPFGVPVFKISKERYSKGQ